MEAFQMLGTRRRALRGPGTKRPSVHLPDGVGGTITGGPVPIIDLSDILKRGAPEPAHDAAVPGAARMPEPGDRSARCGPRDVALSDGSRILFASMADLRAVEDG
jgi:hypothetical protein